jgi:glucose-1-phosphate adenylyltransferase
MRQTVAYLLAGGMGSRLNILGWSRAKPAVPFGGCYRIIDFTLSNIMHSGIQQVGVLTQYRPYSLMGHIGTGEAWDFVGRSRTVKILPPSTGIDETDWYLGTADAIAQNIDFAQRFDAETVLVLSGDHIYKMDYTPMVEFHNDKQADITIAMMEVPWEETKHFGIAILDDDQKIVKWQEKPKKADNNLASMGVYVFNFKYLRRILSGRDKHDFGKHVIPHALSHDRAYAYLFDGYWADVGTLRALWDTNMDILRPNSGLNLSDWGVRSNYVEEGLRGDRPPSQITSSARIQNSLISFGCRIKGEVKNSIISPGVCIEKGAKVEDSVVMHDSLVDENACLYEVIADKRSTFGKGVSVGTGSPDTPNEKYPDHVYTGLTIIGKEALIPAGIEIGRNSIVEPHVDEKCYSERSVKEGSYIACRK